MSLYGNYRGAAHRKSNLIYQNRKEMTTTLYYKLQLADSPRFMMSSLSNLFGNLVKKFIKAYAMMDMITKNVKRVKLKTKIVIVVLNTEMFKMIQHCINVYVVIEVTK